MQRSFKRGFTLVELLVVMSIIGVLMGLMFIGFGLVNKKRMELQVKAVLTQINVGLVNTKEAEQRRSFFFSGKVNVNAAVDGGAGGGDESYGFGATVVDLRSQAAILQNVLNIYIVKELYPNHAVLQASVSPYVPIINVRRKARIDVKNEKINASGQLLDPWEQPYMYIITRVINPDGSTFTQTNADGSVVMFRQSLLWSSGPDAIDDTLPAILLGSSDYGDDIVRVVSRYDVPNP